MGRDLPAKFKHLQVFKSDKIDDGIINEKSNSSNKGTDYQSITDMYKGDSNSRTIEGYDKYSSHDWKLCDSDKEFFTQKNDQQFISDDDRQRSTLFGTCTKNDWQDSLHTLKHSFEIATSSKSDSDLKSNHGKRDSNNNTSSILDVSTLEHTEKPSTEIHTRIIQKEDCPQQFTKHVPSYLDKCSWYEKSEQEIIDEKSSSDEDNDTVAADLSTSDIFSEEMEDLASESSGSHCDEITFVQASDTSVSGNEDTEDSSTIDDCESDIEENNGDGVFLVDINEQEAPVAVLVNIVEEENDQELPLIENEDADIDITEESVCGDNGDDELSGADQHDVVSQQNRMVVQPFYASLNSTAPIDQTAKHHMLTNNGYNTEIVGDTANLVMVNNVQVEIPQIQDIVNPLLPVQSRLQDYVDGQPLPTDHLGNDSIDQTDSVEQAEDLPMSNSSLSMSLESPQVMEESSIHSFSASSENQSQYLNMLEGAHEEMSDFTETDSGDSEQSDCWLLSTSTMSDLAADVDGLDEHLDII